MPLLRNDFVVTYARVGRSAKAAISGVIVMTALHERFEYGSGSQ